MKIILLLEPVVKSERLTFDIARSIIQSDWREIIEELQGDLKREAESLLYFIEGYVEDVNEGFTADLDDSELYKTIRDLLSKLHDLDK